MKQKNPIAQRAVPVSGRARPDLPMPANFPIPSRQALRDLVAAMID